MPDADLRSALIRLAHDNRDLRPHLLPLLKTASPIALPYAQVMLALIEPPNKSKFYEMQVSEAGLAQPAKKKKVHGMGQANWVLQRRWGRLKGTGEPGRVDSFNDFFDSDRDAYAAMDTLKREKMSKGYKDYIREKSYPLGLGPAGFGWGGQAACRVIPELQQLLADIQQVKVSLRGLARKENEVAVTVQGFLDPLETYLTQQLSQCRV